MEWIAVGIIVNTHGIRGELKVVPLTYDTNRFKDLTEAYIGEEKELVHVKNSRITKNTVIIAFEEFDNINQVLKFKDSYLYVDEENRIKLPENTYFISDLIGLQLVDDSGNLCGELIDVIQGAANDVYLISFNDKKYMIPAVKEFIKDVDIDNKLMTVSLIEGMIE